MTETKDALDPRIRRTRLLLQQAMEKLLQEKEFEKISVQDIADAATINRVTFYDHYTDKFALLACMVGARFHELLDKRKVEYSAGCSAALSALIQCVCDYLAATPRIADDQQRLMEPHLEAAVIAVVQRMLLEGHRKHFGDNPVPTPVPIELVSTTVAWAIYGAAQEWVRTPNRPPSEEIVKTIASMVEPIFSVMSQGRETSSQ
ncbi:MAG TPA: TetR/AcrR family transcriptional regulator [Chroococcales cyanobacterium]